MGASCTFQDWSKMPVTQLLLMAWAVPWCLGGETCSISHGSTTITAFCETSCCSNECCEESETEGISTVAIALSVLVVIIVILLIIVIIVISYRKKKPACCYKSKEEKEDEEKVLEDDTHSPNDLIVQDNKKKDSTTDECSSGYSSSQSVKSITNSKHRPTVARAASPFSRESDTPSPPPPSPLFSQTVAPPMSIPRSTAMPPRATDLRFVNTAFDKSGDKTEILRLKKQKTVTFKKNKIDSPRGSISVVPNDDSRPKYPAILPPLSKSEKKSSDIFSTKNKPNDSTKEGPTNDIAGYKLSRHRQSYPAENKTGIGFLRDEHEVKPKSTIFNTKSSSSPPPPSRTKPTPMTDSETKSQSIPNMFDIVQTPKKSITSSSRRRNTDYNIKESSYVPTIVQAADSKDSINSLEMEDNKDNTKDGHSPNSFSSPYLAIPYTIKKDKRVHGTIPNWFSRPSTSSPASSTKSGDIPTSKSSAELANGSSFFVSSFMKERTTSSTWDSAV